MEVGRFDDEIDLVVAFQTAVRGAHRPLTLEQDQQRVGVLEEVHSIVKANAERLGEWLLGELVAIEQKRLRERVIRAAEESRRERQTVTRVAAESDGLALTLDGGPSDLGAAEWAASVAVWAEGRV